MAQPNFLFFVTDQQRYDHVGYAGTPLLKTPNIDSLAENGAWFSRFYVSSPTCMSSRATMMTGRMPSLHGVRMNGVPLNLDSVTFVDLLRAAGYRTSLIGKCHIQSMLEAKSMVPETKFPDGLQAPPPDLAEAMRNHHDPQRYTVEMQEVWARTPDKADQIELPYYGFDHVDFVMGHGDLVAGHYNNWLRQQGGGDVARGIDNARETSDVNAPQVYRPELDEERYPTRYIGNQTVSWLEQYAAQSTDEPFFIQCSFPDPHHPFTPPGDYYSMYSPDEVALPDSFYTPSKEAIPPVRLLWEEYESGQESKRWTWPFATGEAETRDITAKTFGQITMIDDAIGQVLSALDRLGLRDNTVLVFFSDHGDYLGDHKLMLKGPMHYQSIIRVPFVWSDPDPSFHCGRNDAMTSILDLAKTVLYRAGLQPFNGIQGEDLYSVMDGSNQLADRSILIESTTQFPYLGFDDVVSVTSLVDQRWRLSIWQGCEWGELYDVENDPGEIVNLWDDPNYSDVLRQLLHRLALRTQDHAETSPYPTSVS